jgi:hypothetical protein
MTVNEMPKAVMALEQTFESESVMLIGHMVGTPSIT